MGVLDSLADLGELMMASSGVLILGVWPRGGVFTMGVLVAGVDLAVLTDLGVSTLAGVVLVVLRSVLAGVESFCFLP